MSRQELIGQLFRVSDNGVTGTMIDVYTCLGGALSFDGVS